MSVKMVNGEKLYSMTGVVNEFLNEESKKEVLKFISLLLRCDIITKNTIVYGERKHYVYTPSAWFSDKYEGHYYTENKKYRGKNINGTLFFDTFMAKTLSRLYRFYISYNETSISQLSSITFDRVVLETALEYVPKIKQIDDELKKREDGQREYLQNKKQIDEIRKKMTKGITRVNKNK